MSEEKLHFRKLVAILVAVAVLLVVISMVLSSNLAVTPELPKGYTTLENPQD